MSLIEIIIAIAILAVVMGTMIAGVQKEASGLTSLATITARERQAQELVQRIEGQLEYATSAAPNAFLQAGSSPSSTQLTLDNSFGFPPSGIVRIVMSDGSHDRFSYSEVDGSTHQLLGLSNIDDCDSPQGAPAGATVQWSGSAITLDNQINPLPSQYDGEALGIVGPIFFRGEGTGFAFRVPTDPTGGSNFFDAGRPVWGHEVNGTPSITGWGAISYLPESRMTETELGVDVNGDGDELDEFDLGRLGLAYWDALDPENDQSTAPVCPAFVLQERCNYGGDLDGDGLLDPMFLWNPSTQTLTVRLSVLTGIANGIGKVRHIRTSLFLRNGVLN